MTNDEFNLYVETKNWTSCTITSAEWERLSQKQLEIVQAKWMEDTVQNEEVIGSDDLTIINDSPSDDAPVQYAID